MTVKRRARHQYIHMVLFFRRPKDGPEVLSAVRGAFLGKKNASEYGASMLPKLGDVCEVKSFALKSETKS